MGNVVCINGYYTIQLFPYKKNSRKIQCFQGRLAIMQDWSIFHFSYNVEKRSYYGSIFHSVLDVIQCQRTTGRIRKSY